MLLSQLLRDLECDLFVDGLKPVSYTHLDVYKRQAFGRPIGSFQNSRFKMAEIKTELTVGRAFVDQCIEKHVNGELSIEEAAMAKWWTTELLGKVTDECLQLHGGYGYTNEYDISRAWVDARITSCLLYTSRCV